jgi:hypothetical protein
MLPDMEHTKIFFAKYEKNVMGHKKNSCITKENVITYKKVGEIGYPACWLFLRELVAPLAGGSCVCRSSQGLLVFGNL